MFNCETTTLESKVNGALENTEVMVQSLSESSSPVS